MNREILFRGKRVDNGEWVEGYLMDENYINVPFNDDDVNGRFDEPIEINSETVCECTGLPDRKCKKIFEGDIITVGGKLKDTPLTVEWDTDSARFVLNKDTSIDGRIFSLEDYYWGYDVRIIGNIFDE